MIFSWVVHLKQKIFITEECIKVITKLPQNIYKVPTPILKKKNLKDCIRGSVNLSRIYLLLCFKFALYPQVSIQLKYYLTHEMKFTILWIYSKITRSFKRGITEPATCIVQKDPLTTKTQCCCQFLQARTYLL